eukprot:5916138-Alexandrium_andersonii.AAC.1
MDMVGISARLDRKYGGLPPDAPPPAYRHLLRGPRWDVWEWWAGSAGVTAAAEHLALPGGGRKLLAGPPITREQ